MGVQCVEVRALRHAMRDRQGPLRGVPVESIRHAMRRAAKVASRDRVAAMRGQWADYGPDGERVA